MTSLLHDYKRCVRILGFAAYEPWLYAFCLGLCTFDFLTVQGRVGHWSGRMRSPRSTTNLFTVRRIMYYHVSAVDALDSIDFSDQVLEMFNPRWNMFIC